MAINWFPGHMHKTRKALAKLMPQTDVVIEVLDARLPHASHNPLLAELRGSVPCFYVVTKTDLADPEKTQQWQQYFQQQNWPSVWGNTVHDELVSQLKKQVRALVPTRGTADKPLRLLVVGIPNVGKSTLLNKLVGRKICTVGNTPAVTREAQRIKVETGLVVFDTPGVMWPKPEDEECGYRLALSGAIRDTAFEYPDVAYFAIEALQKGYPQQLQAAYHLESLHEDPLENMAAIAKRRGMVSRGEPQWQRVSELIVHEFRQGKIGKFTLEMPTHSC